MTHKSTRGQRILGPVIAVGLHTFISVAWAADRPNAPVNQSDGPRIEWVELPLLREHVAAPTEPLQTKSTTERARNADAGAPIRLSERRPGDSPVSAGLLASGAAGPTPNPSSSDAVAMLPAAPTAIPPSHGDSNTSDLVESAREAVGNIDRQLRHESGKQPTMGADTRYSQFRAAVEAATIKKWHGIATVTETAMPGTGEKLIKISNGKDEYCIRIPLPSAGIDRYEWERKNFHPITCPR